MCSLTPFKFYLYNHCSCQNVGSASWFHDFTLASYLLSSNRLQFPLSPQRKIQLQQKNNGLFFIKTYSDCLMVHNHNCRIRPCTRHSDHDPDFSGFCNPELFCIIRSAYTEKLNLRNCIGRAENRGFKQNPIETKNIY